MKLAGLAMLLVGLLGCGGGAGGDPQIDARILDAAQLDASAIDGSPLDADPIDASFIDATPIDAMSPDAQAVQTCDLAAGGGSHVVFLSFDGETLTQGADDAALDRFLYSPASGAVIPAWRAAAPDRAALVESVACDVRAALEPYDVTVVTTRPLAGDYQMLVLGGDPGVIEAPFGSMAIAAIDCAAANPRNVGWIGERESPVATPFTLTVTRNLVLAELGKWAGLELASDPGDCLCDFNGSLCTVALDACTYGTASTTTTTVCSSATTQDEPAKLLARYGARP